MTGGDACPDLRGLVVPAAWASSREREPGGGLASPSLTKPALELFLKLLE